MEIIKRPKLDAKVFRQFYWLKKELTDFCIEVGLSTAGMKLEITERIYTFLSTGNQICKIENLVQCRFYDTDPKGEQPRMAASNIIKPIRKKTGVLDSSKPINPKTVVVNYKNDPATRDFFIKQIGPHFKFSARVNIFRKEAEAQGKKITYGDLIQEWLREYKLRKDKNVKLPIMSSCEYNQFTRDYYAANPNAARKEVVAAWKQARTLAGAHTYKAWLRAFK